MNNFDHLHNFLFFFSRCFKGLGQVFQDFPELEDAFHFYRNFKNCANPGWEVVKVNGSRSLRYARVLGHFICKWNIEINTRTCVGLAGPPCYVHYRGSHSHGKPSFQFFRKRVVFQDLYVIHVFMYKWHWIFQCHLCINLRKVWIVQATAFFFFIEHINIDDCLDYIWEDRQ